MEIYEPVKNFVIEMVSTRFAQSFFAAIAIVWGVSLLPILKTKFSWKTVFATALILFGLSIAFFR